MFEDDPQITDLASEQVDDLFAEMIPFMVDVPSLDDSRESIYSAE